MKIIKCLEEFLLYSLTDKIQHMPLSVHEARGNKPFAINEQTKLSLTCSLSILAV